MTVNNNGLIAVMGEFFKALGLNIPDRYTRLQFASPWKGRSLKVITDFLDELGITYMAVEVEKEQFEALPVRRAVNHINLMLMVHIPIHSCLLLTSFFLLLV